MRKFTRVLAAAVVLGMGASAANAALVFGPGNVIVSKVTMPEGGTTSQAGTVTLLEYTPAGVEVGSMIMPTAGAEALTFKLSATTEGGLKLSPDGRYITLAGYRADVGSANPGTTAGVPRVVGRLDTTTGALNTGTEFTAFTGDSIRGAVTSNGTDFWVSGSGTGNDGGLRHVAGSGFGTSTTTVGVNNDAASGNSNNRQTTIANGQLYVASGASRPGTGVHQVGTGLPTTDGQAYTLITAPGTVNDLFFADLSDTVAGADTLYTVGNNLLSKYTFDGSSWTASGTIATSAIYVYGAESEGGMTLYGTLPTTDTGGLVSYEDTSGYGGTLPAGAFAPLANPVTAGPNSQLRGVVVVPIPEPAGMALLGVGALAVLARRRRLTNNSA